MVPQKPAALRRTLRLLTPLLLVTLFLASSAAAQEKLASYPQLPKGYSSIRIFDNQGRFVGRILPTQRYWVSGDRIPTFLKQALVAIEDSRFYEHPGIDVRGIARAIVKDVVKGRLAEGGSTITQQLIKNKYLSGEKTLDRKVKEGLLAIEYEKKYTKDQILEMYFNQIYFGNGAWGIAQAARLYFDKNPEELTEAECSILAGVPKNPGRYNPLGDVAKVSARRSLVLNRMVTLNMITPAHRKQIEANPATVIKGGQAPSYLAHLRNKLVERYGARIVEQGGLDVISAMDLNLQNIAEKTLREGVKKVSPTLQGGLLAMDPVTGNVLAAVGGVDASSAFNRAFIAKRQPGSSIKPLIFAAALEEGVTAATLWDDQPVSYNRGNGALWKPRNYEGKVYGELSLREALAYSNNVITVKLLDTIGVPTFVSYAGNLGLPLRRHDLSLALGTEEVTLSQLVSAYTPLANNGLRAEPRTIIRIFERNRRAWNESPPAVTQAISPASAYVTTQMLKDVMVYGTAKGLKSFSHSRPSAGKTGTTDDYRDAWFIGYTPNLVAGVWVGHDKPQPGGKGFTGGAVSAPIWERFMRQATAGKPVVDFTRPETVVAVTIDPKTGYLAAPDCPKTKEEFFVAGTEPTRYCPEHGGAAMEPVLPRTLPEVPRTQPELPRTQPEVPRTQPEVPGEPAAPEGETLPSLESDQPVDGLPPLPEM